MDGIVTLLYLYYYTSSTPKDKDIPVIVRSAFRPADLEQISESLDLEQTPETLDLEQTSETLDLDQISKRLDLEQISQDTHSSDISARPSALDDERSLGVPLGVEGDDVVGA